jgi:SpoVK/Ycf46/Vps4 family AAA+-type ATPase
MAAIKDWLPEFEVSAETDTELQEYFLQTPELEKIINSKYWLLLGRKGTGKTAI